MTTDYMVASRDISLIHPVWSCQLWKLVQAVEAKFASGSLHRHWRIFETYRHPDRQDMLLRQGTTRAGAWHSPHQYGLAADWASYDQDRWDWPVTQEAYQELHELGHTFGIRFPISWDPGHCQSPVWDEARKLFLPSK